MREPTLGPYSTNGLARNRLMVQKRVLEPSIRGNARDVDRDCRFSCSGAAIRRPVGARRVTALGQKHAPAIEQSDDSFHLGTVIAPRFRGGDGPLASHRRRSRSVCHGRVRRRSASLSRVRKTLDAVQRLRLGQRRGCWGGRSWHRIGFSAIRGNAQYELMPGPWLPRPSTGSCTTPT